MAVKQRSSRKPPGVGRHAAKGDSNVSEGSEHKSTLKVDWRRIITRIVMMISIMLVVYFTQADKVVPFATQQEVIPKRSVDIACSKDYADELKHFPGCTPVKCGRVIFDSVVTLSEVEALLNIAHRGLSLGGSSGGASILDLHSGALSHGSDFINIYKLEEAKNIFTTEDFKIYSHVKNKIHGAIADHFGINKDKLYLTHPTFFSRIISAPPQTVHDEYWHPHVDKVDCLLLLLAQKICIMWKELQKVYGMPLLYLSLVIQSRQLKTHRCLGDLLVVFQFLNHSKFFSRF
ncbi:2-oxoglutarate and iron-dependent oxygenase domain-containing protein 3-like isoform X2 [Macrobrachium rosenbergii]|uniref:2-oxoglutarate and iron-dependent oxygenase domain-containing protein 3-like isoform X2 n=1 Tax=Macrobrachium rosenbergii TaxID=79674 RepID=UPI0034D43D31